MRANAKSNFKISKAKEKNYGKGWTSQFETGRLSYQGVIYNKDLPGLPHLLEHGHAKRGGGRVDGRVHIKPVEDEIVKKFEKEVKQAIDRAGA